MRDQAKEFMQTFSDRVLGAAASGQARHACYYFALAAYAGQLATGWGLTGWPDGEAAHACAGLFRSWVDARGGSGEQEHIEYVRRLQGFIEQHGDGMFAPRNGENQSPPTDDNHRPRTLKRVGFYQEIKHYESAQAYPSNSDFDDENPGSKLVATERVYYILPNMWRDEVFKGMDARAAARHLLKLEVLEPAKTRADYRLIERCACPQWAKKQQIAMW